MTEAEIEIENENDHEIENDNENDNDNDNKSEDQNDNKSDNDNDNDEENNSKSPTATAEEESTTPNPAQSEGGASEEPEVTKTPEVEMMAAPTREVTMAVEPEPEPLPSLSGPKADKACARCKRHHKGCDKSLPVCSSCLKMFGEIGAAKRMCNYNYVVHPGRRIEEFTSERQTTDDSATAAANARRKMELRRAEIDRLRKIILHLCDRDLDIIPHIAKMDYNFLDPESSKGYRVSAPEEFKTLFKTDMWDWPQATMDIVPLLLKDGVIGVVKPGEEKTPKEFSRQHYEKKAEDGKDGWEEQFGEKPNIEHWQHLVRRLEHRSTPSGDMGGLKSPAKRRRVVEESDESEDGAFASDSAEPSKRRATLDSTRTPDRAELVGRYEPKPSVPAFRAVRAVQASGHMAPTPRARAMVGGGGFTPANAPPASPGEGPDVSLREALEGMERDIIEITKHAGHSTDELVKAASRHAVEELRRKVEDLRKAERDLSTSTMSPTAKSVLVRSIVKMAMSK